MRVPGGADKKLDKPRFLNEAGNENSNELELNSPNQVNYKLSRPKSSENPEGKKITRNSNLEKLKHQLAQLKALKSKWSDDEDFSLDDQDSEGTDNKVSELRSECL